jgi:hypothetical protein
MSEIFRSAQKFFFNSKKNFFLTVKKTRVLRTEINA